MRLSETAINVTLLAAVFVGGCVSPMILQSKYSPQFSGNVPRLNSSVIIREVKDLRLIEKDMYFEDKSNLYDGRFDRPIQAIVKEAIASEFKRAGLKVVEPSMPHDSNTLVLECSIEKFEVTIATGPADEPLMNASVTLVFNWLDVETDALASVRRRSETSTIRRSRDLGWPESKTDFNHYFVEDRTDLQTQGSKLIEELLPKVIQTELRESSILGRRLRKIRGVR